ncbi:DUF2336 domain-containing protein [Roseibium litorale]|uniref:DUF2336 domain-containing protein n=1 Tax=Roseibium litorale TaxID=2803841 RepID=UPI0017845853
MTAAADLVCAWKNDTFGAGARKALTSAMTLLLDDPCVTVRTVLAAGIADRSDVPFSVVLALAGDEEEAAVPVVSRSQLLSDADLIDCLAHPSGKVGEAVAGRKKVSPALCAAIAEVAPAGTVLALLTNPGAALLAGTLARLTERFGRDADIRNALLHLTELPVALRHRLLHCHAETLVTHPLVLPHVQDEEDEREFLAEASDKIALKLAEASDEDGLAELVEHLRATGGLTTRLLLRSLCCGQNRFFVCAMSALTGVPSARFAQTLVSGRPAALRALLRKAGLPVRSYQVFVLAIEIARRRAGSFTSDLSLELTKQLTEQVLSELQDDGLSAQTDIVTFLRRFAADIARQEARLVLDQLRKPALHAA